MRPRAALAVTALLALTMSHGARAATAVHDGDSAVWPQQPDAPEGVAQLGLNVAVNDAYLDQLRALHRDADPAVVDRLLRSQQLWRRAAEPPQQAAQQQAPGARRTYSLLDCTPMYVHRRSWMDVLRRAVIKIYTCHAVCLNYPSCSTTAPLAAVEPRVAADADGGAVVVAERRLGFVVACGARVFAAGDGGDADPGRVLDIYTAPSPGSRLCRNAPARARNFGGGLQYYAGPAAASRGVTEVTLSAAPGTPLDDGLVVNSVDLWSHFAVQPLRLLHADEGADFLAPILVPLRGDLDRTESASGLAAALAGANTTQDVLRALWLVTPQVSGYMSARFSHRTDTTCPRWLSFPFTGVAAAAGAPGSVYAAYANASGACPEVFASLERAARYLVGLSAAGPDSAGPCKVPNYADSYTTTTTCAAGDRLRQGTGAPVALDKPLGAVAELAAVRGCGGRASLFSLDAFPGFGDAKCGPAYATPGIEVVMLTGQFVDTYLDAGLLHDALALAGAQDAGAGAGAGGAGRWPVEHRWLDLRVQANATHFAQLIDVAFQRDAAVLSQLKLGPAASRDRASILTALGLLLVATLQLPLAYDKNVRHTIVRLADRFSPCDGLRHHRAIWVFAGCLIALAAPVAAAMVSLVLACRTQADEVYLMGYPQVSYVSAPFGHKQLEQARNERLGLQTTTTVTVQMLPVGWALAGICSGCGLLVVLGAFLSAHRQWKEDDAEFHAAAAAHRAEAERRQLEARASAGGGGSSGDGDDEEKGGGKRLPARGGPSDTAARGGGWGSRRGTPVGGGTGRAPAVRVASVSGGRRRGPSAAVGGDQLVAASRQGDGRE